jgi:LysM repeat protein
VLVLPDYIAVGTLAKSLGVNRDTLESINMSLKPTVWNGTKKVPKGYEFRVPSSAGDPQLLLASLSHDAWDSKQTPDLFHVVQRGETLSSIAPRYGARVSDLVAINSLSKSARIKEGQKLILPAGVSKSSGEPVIDQGIYPDTVVEAQRVAAAKAAPKVAAPAVASTIAPAAPSVATGVTAKPPAEVAANIPSAVAEVAADDAAAEAGDTIGTAETIEQAAAAEQEVAVALPAVPPPSQAQRWWKSSSGNARRPQATIQWRKIARSECRKTKRSVTTRLAGRESERSAAHERHEGTSAVRVGKRLKLDFSKATSEQFEGARLAYHQNLQEQFFANHRIVATSEHVVKPGESIWVLAGRKYNIPVWLLRQYNPDLDLSMVKTVDPSRHSGSGEPGSVTLRRAALGSLLILAVAYGVSPWLAAKLLPPLLARWGVESSRFSFGYPRWNGVDVTALQLATAGTTVTGTNVRVSYRIWRLFRGELEAVDVGELTVRLGRSAGSVEGPGSFDIASFWSLIRRVRSSSARLDVANAEPAVTAHRQRQLRPGSAAGALRRRESAAGRTARSRRCGDPDGAWR